MVQAQRRRAVSECSLGIGTCDYSELTVPEAAEVAQAERPAQPLELPERLGRDATAPC